MGDPVSTASWNLAADSLDCGINTFDAVADAVKDKLDWTRDLLAARSPSDFVGVCIQHSAKQALKSVGQWQTVRELHGRLSKDYVTLWRTLGLLPPLFALPASTQKTDALSPEREVLLLHIME